MDGFGSAYAAWKKLKDKATYLPVSYGKPMPEMPNAKEIYILDFSYPRQQLIDLGKKVEKLVVLDHHTTAEKDLENLEFAHFDMNRSGAGMSWDYFHKDPRPAIINSIEDRDLWLFKIEGTQHISLALSSYPMDFELWDKLEFDTLLKEGKTIERFANQLMNESCSHCHEIELDGHKVPAINSPLLTSDVGNMLLKRYPEAPFSVVYYTNKNGDTKYSLRSSDDKKDVEEVALKFGGGGHRNASGFIKKK
jgi:oligoribonuclease NrnB/cAMP/cGMP phosphodiesterase (DHH superfamily)